MSAREPHPPSTTAIQDAALHWLLERDEGFTPGRAAEFAAWCASDPRHRKAVIRAEAGLQLLHALPAAGPSVKDRFARSTATPDKTSEPGLVVPFPRSRVRQTSLWIAGIAAAAAVALLIPGKRPSAIAETAQAQHFVTDSHTVRRHLALEDGSVLHLNTASDLHVQLSAHERTVSLEKGEAHFAVAPDPERPFVVRAGGLIIRAVGTAFDVRTSGSSVEVIVHEGRVDIRPDTTANPRESNSFVGSRAASPATSASLLSAGERIRAESGHLQSAEPINANALQDALAWHGGAATFAGVPLRDVVERFNRHNAVQLAITDPRLAARRIGGTFSLDRIGALVHLLEQEGDVVADRSQEGIVSLSLRR
ncbi:MAG TPA: FecR domain-containing protein [Opitutaceae bacterium]|nr:FecR domain-containing protein [Opitutaceae bacterium]